MSHKMWGSMNSGSLVPPNLLDIQTRKKKLDGYIL